MVWFSEPRFNKNDNDSGEVFGTDWQRAVARSALHRVQLAQSMNDILAGQSTMILKA